MTADPVTADRTGSTGTSARSLRTVPAVGAELARRPSGYVLASATLTALGVRRRLGRVGVQDAVAVLLVAAAQPFVEWGLHRLVLHGRPRRVVGRTVDPGAVHRRHHAEPDDVAGLLLGGRFALADAGLAATAVAAAGAATAPLLGRFPARAVATGAAAGVAGLARYEWCHLLVHSGARLRSSRLRRLRAHHMAHHHRDETRWLGVSSDLADRWFGTGGDVRLAGSRVARSLA